MPKIKPIGIYYAFCLIVFLLGMLSGYNKAYGQPMKPERPEAPVMPIKLEPPEPPIMPERSEPYVRIQPTIEDLSVAQAALTAAVNEYLYRSKESKVQLMWVLLGICLYIIFYLVTTRKQNHV